MNPGQIRKWTPVKNHFLDLGGWFPYFDCLSGREWIIFIYINKMFLHYTSYKFTYPYWAGRMVGNPCLRVGRGKLAEIQKQIILSLNIFKFLIFFKLKKPTPPKLIKNTNLEFLSWLSRDKALSFNPTDLYPLVVTIYCLFKVFILHIEIKQNTFKIIDSPNTCFTAHLKYRTFLDFDLIDSTKTENMKKLNKKFSYQEYWYAQNCQTPFVKPGF